MQDSDRKHILRRIAEVENRITGLQEEQEEAQATLRALRIQLAHADPQICITHKDTDEAHVSEHLTPAEKVALFLRLFRGRDDVYPKLWQNPKTGKKGYAPACANEWVRGVYEKPRVKCGECSNQAFLPLTRQPHCIATSVSRPRG